MVKNFIGCSAEAPDTDKETATVLHVQAGHSLRTAHQTYGVSSLDMRQLTGTELEQYRIGSQAWHNALRISHGLADSLSTNNSTKDSFPTYIQKTPSPSSNPSHTSHSELFSRLARVQQLLTRVLDSQLLTSALTDRKRPLQFDKDNSNSQPKKSKPDPIPSFSDPAQALKAFFESDEANSRSAQQKEAIIYALRVDVNRLVAFLTGIGKSLLFMLPAIIFPRRVMIVIVLFSSTKRRSPQVLTKEYPSSTMDRPRHGWPTNHHSKC